MAAAAQHPPPHRAAGLGRVAPRAPAALAALAAAALLPAAAAAGIETQGLYAGAGWEVILSHDSDDGTLWCVAETANRRGQALHLMVLDDGRAGFAVVDPRWFLGEGPFDLVIEIDRDVLRFEGLAAGSAITVLPRRPEAGRRLLSALAAAGTVALRDGLGGWIAGFALPGIGPAAAALVDCAAAIALPGAAPGR